MIVIGGVYSEYCSYPFWDQIFGSGGRGAAVLTRLGVEPVKLFTCLPDSDRAAALATLTPYGIELEIFSSQQLCVFIYTHPLAEPRIRRVPLKPTDYGDPISGDVVLIYGMLEGIPKVKARRAVYDPQSESDCQRPEDFINAEEIAIVLNQHEFEVIYGRGDVQQTSQKIFAEGRICVLVLKQGPFGCTVIDKTGLYFVPVFPSGSVFKIGSGDVFSASFAKFWGQDDIGPAQAAQLASRCTSLYCNTQSIDAVASFSEFDGLPRERRRAPVIYLAGPFFSLAQRFLVEEARSAILKLGAELFSPFHDVGCELPIELIAKEDLNGLEACSVVLALLTDMDPGTIFEVGFARARNIPVVVFAEDVKKEHLTMLIGTGCIICEDFCSAIYNAIWAGM
jgi:nucleoside 2-deoxyribosyltransferase